MACPGPAHTTLQPCHSDLVNHHAVRPGALPPRSLPGSVRGVAWTRGRLTQSLCPQHYFTVNFSHENQKALELRTEDAKDCDEWVAAIAHARYDLGAGTGGASIRLSIRPWPGEPSVSLRTLVGASRHP